MLLTSVGPPGRYVRPFRPWRESVCVRGDYFQRKRRGLVELVFASPGRAVGSSLRIQWIDLFWVQQGGGGTDRGGNLDGLSERG
jgi:hypothetical protein